MKQKIIIYDNTCNLCKRIIDFIRKNDSKKIFKFITDRKNLNINLEIHFTNNVPNYVIFIDDLKIFIKSDAVIEILYSMGGIYKIIKLIKIFPLSLRNYCYDIIAKYRYNFFNKNNSCNL